MVDSIGICYMLMLPNWRDVQRLILLDKKWRRRVKRDERDERDEKVDFSPGLKKFPLVFVLSTLLFTVRLDIDVDYHLEK